MPKWTLRSPTRFPPTFFRALETLCALHSHRAFDEQVQISPQPAWKGDTIADCLKVAEQFRYYRWCIRQHPFYDYHNFENENVIKTKLLPVQGYPDRRTLVIHAYRRPDPSFIEEILQHIE